MEPYVTIYYDEKSRAVIGKMVPDAFPGDAAGLSFGYIEAMEDTVQVRCPLRGYLSVIVMRHRVYPAFITVVQCIGELSQWESPRAGPKSRAAPPPAATSRSRASPCCGQCRGSTPSASAIMAEAP